MSCRQHKSKQVKTRKLQCGECRLTDWKRVLNVCIIDSSPSLKVADQFVLSSFFHYVQQRAVVFSAREMIATPRRAAKLTATEFINSAHVMQAISLRRAWKAWAPIHWGSRNPDLAKISLFGLLWLRPCLTASIPGAAL